MKAPRPIINDKIITQYKAQAEQKGVTLTNEVLLHRVLIREEMSRRYYREINKLKREVRILRDELSRRG